MLPVDDREGYRFNAAKPLSSLVSKMIEPTAIKVPKLR